MLDESPFAPLLPAAAFARCLDVPDPLDLRDIAQKRGDAGNAGSPLSFRPTIDNYVSLFTERGFGSSLLNSLLIPGERLTALLQESLAAATRLGAPTAD